jgi:trimeric autotransporter adhesin
MKQFYPTLLFTFWFFSITKNASAQANTALSNLTAPTAVNRNLLPASNGALDLGSEGFQWNFLYINAVRASGDITAGGNLFVAGATTLTGKLSTLGDATIGNNFTVTGDVRIMKNLKTSGDATFTGNLTTNGNAQMTQLKVAGTGAFYSVVTDGLQVLGGSPAAGYVLTSNAAGVATWQPAAAAGGAWSLIGNAGTVDGINFIGTTDSVPLTIRVNNEPSGRLDPGLANTFWGFHAGSHTTGGDNTGIGQVSLYENSSGAWNTSVGYWALNLNTTGGANTAIGHQALSGNRTGSDLTAIGSGADVSIDTLQNATAIGANALVKASNTIQLGNHAITTVYVGTGTTATLITGGLQVTGGTLAAGNVLTSDANGVASWQPASGGSSSGWGLTGNAGTVDGTNFIGTTDNVAFTIRVNNQPSGRIDSSTLNTFWGYQAGLANSASSSTGTRNNAIGFAALSNNTSGSFNTATGPGALLTNTSGNSNTANGFSALYLNSNGNNNTANGDAALISNTTGSNNTADGSNSMFYNQSGSSNSSFGAIALAHNITGNYLTAVGDSTDVSKDGLTNSTAIGYGAVIKTSNTIQLGNTAVDTVYAGVGTAATLVTGGLKVTGGTLAAGNVLTSDANGVASWQPASGGSSSGWGLTGNAGTVDGTNFIGTTDNVAFTIRVNNQPSGRIDPTKQNAFFGYQSGNAASSTGQDNSATGYQSLYTNTSGNQNTANGALALFSNSTGYENLANGFSALYDNQSGSQNTANGNHALYLNTSGSDNTATGSESLLNNNGNNNTGTGYLSLYYNGTGGNNTAGGYESLWMNISGSYNTASGYESLQTNISGSDLTAIGAGADVNIDGLTNSTAIGYKAIMTADNQVVVGNSSITSFQCAASLTSLSDGRYKKNIKQNVPGLEFINQLQPITYTLDVAGIEEKLNGGRRETNGPDGKAVPKLTLDQNAINESSKVIHTGFIAQDVEAAAKKLAYDFSGVDKPKDPSKSLYGLRYAEFVVPLVKAVQELSSKNDSLTAVVAQLQDSLNNVVAQMSDRLSKIEQILGIGNNKQNAPAVELSSAKLYQNIPNPFNQSTQINYYIPYNASSAMLQVTDMTGVIIKSVAVNSKGNGQLTLATNQLASGTYAYTLIVDGNIIDTKIMILAK